MIRKYICASLRFVNFLFTSLHFNFSTSTLLVFHLTVVESCKLLNAQQKLFQSIDQYVG